VHRIRAGVGVGGDIQVQNEEGGDWGVGSKTGVQIRGRKHKCTELGAWWHRKEFTTLHHPHFPSPLLPSKKNPHWWIKNSEMSDSTYSAE
jgi:hypothetical protein